MGLTADERLQLGWRSNRKCRPPEACIDIGTDVTVCSHDATHASRMRRLNVARMVAYVQRVRRCNADQIRSV